MEKWSKNTILAPKRGLVGFYPTPRISAMQTTSCFNVRKISDIASPTTTETDAPINVSHVYETE